MGLGYGGSWIDRVADAIEPTPGLTIVAAPPGFGVSVLAERLHARSQRQFANTEPGSTCRYAVIRENSVADVCESALSALETDVRVVVAGRSIPDELRTHDSQLVDHSTMRLEEHEALGVANEQGVPEAVARAIWVFTGGWPAYFLSCGCSPIDVN